MCRLLIDAMVWNYIAKAGCLEGFIESLEIPAVILPRVADQLQRAMSHWPELASVLEAKDAGEIDCEELTSDEHLLQISLLDQHSGLGDVDCALLAVASERGWLLLTRDDRLSKVAGKLKIQQVELLGVIDDAVDDGYLTDADRLWVTYYSNGGSDRRVE